MSLRRVGQKLRYQTLITTTKEWLADDCVIVAEHWYKTNGSRRFICCKIPKTATPRQVLKKPFYIVVGERKTTDVKVKCAF